APHPFAHGVGRREFGHQVRGHGAEPAQLAAVDLLDQGVAGREVAVERADADAGLARDGLDLDGVRAGTEDTGGGVDDALPVALGVAVPARATVGPGNGYRLQAES